MAAVRHLGFWKFKFLKVWAVKRPILYNRAKFREDRDFVFFYDGGRRHVGF